jgi:large subunit ribosomal protein L31e
LSKEKQNLIERIYTVPLKKAWITPKQRRAKKAMSIIRQFAERHMKSSEIIISPELNEKVWSKGIESPPRRIIVKMIKDEGGIVTISLPIEEIPVSESEEVSESRRSE